MVADQPLLDELATEEDADAEDPRTRTRRLLLRTRGHQNGAFFTVWRMSGMKSCFRLSHSYSIALAVRT